jgi:hypothetical protein
MLESASWIVAVCALGQGVVEVMMVVEEVQSIVA